MQRTRNTLLALLIVAFTSSCGKKAPAPATPAGTSTGTVDTPAAVPETVQVEAESTFETAAGTSMPVPAQWFRTAAPGHVTLEDPDKRIAVHVVEISGKDATQAIAQAWKTALPSLALAVEQTVSPPAEEGLDEEVLVEYATPPRGEMIYVAYAKRKGERVAVVLVSGSKDAIAARGAQVNIIIGGLKPAGFAEVSLRDVAARPIEGELAAQLEAFVQQALDRTQVPGAAVAVVQGGKVVYSKGFGVREQGRKDPVTPDTLMLIGSTTKSMTTLLMATLVDDGRFGWDTPAVQVMPGFALGDPELTGKLTMKHLVCACTGMPRRDLELVFGYAGGKPEDILAAMKSMVPTTGLGETFQYSNQMVAVGGYLAAHAFAPKRPLGDAYDAAMQAKVFGPIGMKSTTLAFDRGARAKNRATPHGFTATLELKPLPVEVERFVVPLRPSGGVWSNANDLSLYILTELARGKSPQGTQVATEKSFTSRWEPQVKTSDRSAYGLGWGVGEYKGVKIIAHTGGTFGFTTLLAFMPDKDLGLVIVSNAAGAGAFIGTVQERLFELALGARESAAQSLEVEMKSLQDAVERQTKTLMTDQPASGWGAAWAGAYAHPDLGTVTLRVIKDALWLDAGEWKSTVVQKKAADGTVSWVLVDPPVAGLELFPEQQDGTNVLVIDWPQKKYVLEPVAGKGQKAKGK